jgi:hypothetical protein
MRAHVASPKAKGLVWVEVNLLEALHGQEEAKTKAAAKQAQADQCKDVCGHSGLRQLLCETRQRISQFRPVKGPLSWHRLPALDFFVCVSLQEQSESRLELKVAPLVLACELFQVHDRCFALLREGCELVPG